MKKVFLKTLALPIAALFLGFGLTWAAAAPKKKPVAKKPAAKTTARKAPATKSKSTAARRTTTSRGKTTYSRSRSRGRSPQPVRARYYRGQQAPTQDRYIEIQQALVTRGFLDATPSGSWDAASAEAMKRFQEEQNLPPTGKITSLSLIALGLGPKRNPLTAADIQPPAPTVP